MRPQEKLKELIEQIKRLSIGTNSFLNQRLHFNPPVPGVLRGACGVENIPLASGMKPEVAAKLKQLFPHTFTSTTAYRVGLNRNAEASFAGKSLRIGIVLSGGPAPGGHNIISGLYDFLQARNTDSVLVGFLKGPAGLVSGKCVVITDDMLRAFRNQGFNLIGTSRTKIESKQQFEMAKEQVLRLRLDGIVICGGDDSNTNAALLADYFVGANVPCRVIGMPKTIDADLRSDLLEMSFGFDTSTKCYSSLLGNVMQECLVRRDRWHFVRLMGRSASHIAVEVALQTHPNYTIVSEEVTEKKQTILGIVQEISDLVHQRAKSGKNYGVVLVPEGLEVSRDMKALVEELNEILVASSDNVEGRLSKDNAAVYKQLPDWLRSQLLSERDPHGNVRVSLIESERLLASLVAKELQRRKDPYADLFRFWCHFFGYQGRCALTSNFDCTYTYVLGHLAGTLVGGATGVIGAVRNLCSPVDEWELVGIPLTSMMRLERRKGKDKPVIEKKLVDLQGKVFKLFASMRASWMLGDCYPNRTEIRTGHLSGDHTPTQTLRIEFPHKQQPSPKL
uniref:Pyrophosphate--fructose 6-phosphate 1-phosphotransferase n=1 Tax=Diplonema papillatum TaxID=91374 RepID=A0A1B4Z3F8_9EUGL|nr:phosphofructokinase [Diplonema papillatum]